MSRTKTPNQFQESGPLEEKDVRFQVAMTMLGLIIAFAAIAYWVLTYAISMATIGQ